MIILEGPQLPSGKDPHLWTRPKQASNERRHFLADFWLHHPESRKYAEIKFDPQVAAMSLRASPVAPAASEDYNLWRGFVITKEMADQYASTLATPEDPTGAAACMKLRGRL